MNSFLITILTVLLVYFGLKFLFKFAKPYLMRYIAKKAGQQFEKAFNNSHGRRSPQHPEGEVSIESDTSTTKTSKSTVGEYVDFEEID